MIIEEDGRKRSIRTPEEQYGIIESDLKSLTADERAVLQAIFDEVKSTGKSSILEAVSELEYDKPVVPIEEWLKNPYYFGEVADFIYPKLKADLIELFSNDYFEVIYSGGIGIGKTTLAAAGIARVIYEISCLKNPQKSYGMAPGSIIEIATISLTEELARKVVFEKLSGFLKNSPYFTEHFPFKMTTEDLRFPKGVRISIGSSTNNAILGRDVMSAIIDEANFYGELPMRKKSRIVAKNTVVDNAEILYDQVIRRIKSRYENKGRLPGMLFLISSKGSISDFIERRIKDSVNDPHVFIREYSVWSVKPDKYDLGKMFRVLVGDEHISSRILADDETDPKELSKDGTGVRVIEIPLELKKEFEKDLEGSLRDIAGVATISAYPFIKKRAKIDECVSKRMFHPFVEESWDVSMPSTFMWDKICYKDPRSGFMKALLHPDAMRHAHIDGSLTGDSTGICIAHAHGEKNVERKDEDGNIYTEPMPIIYVDLVLRCIPPPGGEIQLADIRRVIYSFLEHGFNIGYCTMDSYQSAGSIQKLKEKGIESEVLSVDKNINVYVSLRDAIYEDRLFMYDYKPLKKELRELEFDMVKKKVDHPHSGAKDVADALAAVAYTLTTIPTEPLSMTRSGENDSFSIKKEQEEDRIREKTEMDKKVKAAGGDVIDRYFKDSDDEEGGGVVPPLF